MTRKNEIFITDIFIINRSVYLVTVPRIMFPGSQTTATVSLPPLKDNATIYVYLTTRKGGYHERKGPFDWAAKKEVLASNRRQLITVPFQVKKQNTFYTI